VNVALRREFDLYANLRPAKTYPGVQAPMGNIDLVVVRENIEDLYAGIEFDLDTPELARVRAVIEKEAHTKIREDAAIAIKYISVMGSTRIVKFAFDYAVANGRHKVTAVHKSNIMKFADGLFLRIAREVAQQYPSIEFEDRIVDNMCMQLVQKPDLYDVLVLPNLYGDIVSDLAAGLVGGLGVAPGASDAEVKRAYRKQMSENHPDKLVARGLPESMLEIAKQKTQAIQAAWERIREARGMR